MSTLGPLSGCERTKSGHPETDIDVAKRLAPATWNNSHIGRHRV